MSVVILICECGLKVKAPGAAPGRVGRCPNCGSQLKVPELPAPKNAGAERPREIVEPGYHLEAEIEASVHVPSRRGPIADRPLPGTFVERKNATSLADGVLPALEHSETNWFASYSYPLRGAESLGVMTATSLVFWVFTILVPEYCLGVASEAGSMGTPTLGYLIALISILPVVILSPLVIAYWLQYLGRVLVSSAMGETNPPRSPDRNFDGCFSGLAPWFIWLVLGVCVGGLPVLYYGLSLSSPAEVNYTAASGMLALGLPYMLIALLIAFLHDDALAAKPWTCIAAIFRLGSSYILLCLFVVAACVAAAATFLVALLLRDKAFWLYIVLAVGCWIVVQWTAIVVMRVLGTYYFHHRDRLRWHREHPRWGVAWRL
jgi:hypothetical protein